MDESGPEFQIREDPCFLPVAIDEANPQIDSEARGDRGELESEVFQKNPDTDANKDGKLSWAEYKDHKQGKAPKK